MARENQLPRFRIVPRRLGAAFYSAFFGLFLLNWVYVLASGVFNDGGTVTLNGREVFGEERIAVLRSIHLSLAIPIVPILILFLVHARRLLPHSPFDFIEIGPEGLTVRGLFGRRHRRWEEIIGFSSGSFFLSNPPINWVKAESTSPLRFTLAGYVRHKLFSFGKSQVQAIAAWLDLVRAAYIFGGDSLPPAPHEFVGRIIPLSGGTGDARSKTRSSVIER